jgi:signal transduction histidine kinase
MNSAKMGSILLVDDDISVLDSTSMLLIEHGYDVIASSGAHDAIGIFEEGAVDIVLTDIVMPDTSGIELLRSIHAIDPTVPVILMTAYADMEKVIDALKIGACDFIIKPFNAQMLYHSVEKAFSYRRMMKMENDYRHLLEEYNQEIESLVAERTMNLMALTLADKIRNPASVIGLTCKRILEKEDVPERLKSKLEDIFREAEKLDSIVKDFQSLLKTRKSMFEYEDINEVVKDVILVSHSIAATKRNEIKFYPADHPLKVNMQKNLFQIAISHLLKNALEAAPDGEAVSVSTYQRDETAVIDISDSGHGINQEDMANIFDPMFSTKEKRFGMGLPLVKRIVSEHMGDISVESNPGEYTVFRIELPLRWSENK